MRKVLVAIACVVVALLLVGLVKLRPERQDRAAQARVAEAFVTAFYGSDWDGLISCCDSKSGEKLQGVRQYAGSSVFPAYRGGRANFVAGDRLAVEDFSARTTGHDGKGSVKVECTYTLVVNSTKRLASQDMQFLMKRDGSNWRILCVCGMSPDGWIAGY